MIIAGAGGHAREIFDLLNSNTESPVYFFDNVSPSLPEKMGGLEIITHEEAVKEKLLEDPRFIIGTGNALVRRKMYDLFMEWGGKPFTLIAGTAIISKQETVIGEGSNIMHGAFISNHVRVGKGTLVNTRAHLHHDVKTGEFCEIGPAALLLGKVQIGKEVFIGAGAILLPGIEAGDGSIIGAGAVVTKNVAAGKTVKGNPAV